MLLSDIPDDGIKDESEDEDENADVTKRDPLSSKSILLSGRYHSFSFASIKEWHTHARPGCNRFSH